jgi:hypothetical protein
MVLSRIAARLFPHTHASAFMVLLSIRTVASGIQTTGTAVCAKTSQHQSRLIGCKNLLLVLWEKLWTRSYPFCRDANK